MQHGSTNILYGRISTLSITKYTNLNFNKS